jgi:hypothetical protein
MIYDYESFERESVADIIADRVQKYLGVDLVSLFVSILSVRRRLSRKDLKFLIKLFSDYCDNWNDCNRRKKQFN